MSESNNSSAEMADTDSSEGENMTTTHETPSKLEGTVTDTPVTTDSEMSCPDSKLYIPVHIPVVTFKVAGKKLTLTCGIETEYVPRSDMDGAEECQDAATNNIFKPVIINISERNSSKKDEMTTSPKTTIKIKKITTTSKVVETKDQQENVPVESLTSIESVQTVLCEPESKSVVQETTEENSTNTSTEQSLNLNKSTAILHHAEGQNLTQPASVFDKYELKASISDFENSTASTTTDQITSSETNQNPNKSSFRLIKNNDLKHLYPHFIEVVEPEEKMILKFSASEGKWYVDGNTAPFPASLERYNKPMSSISSRLKLENMDTYTNNYDRLDYHTRKHLNGVISYPHHLPQKTNKAMGFSMAEKKWYVCSDSDTENDDTDDEFCTATNYCYNAGVTIGKPDVHRKGLVWCEELGKFFEKWR